MEAATRGHAGHHRGAVEAVKQDIRAELTLHVVYGEPMDPHKHRQWVRDYLRLYLEQRGINPADMKEAASDQ